MKRLVILVWAAVAVGCAPSAPAPYLGLPPEEIARTEANESVVFGSISRTSFWQIWDRKNNKMYLKEAVFHRGLLGLLINYRPKTIIEFESQDSKIVRRVTVPGWWSQGARLSKLRALSM